MNKYVVRTSMVWLGLIAFAAGVYLYRRAPTRPNRSAPSAIQPLAVGSSEDTRSSRQIAQVMPSSPAAFAPVELSPERMQSIGVKTGTVDWKSITDEIRATGTVEIDERLLSYIQVRYSGYVRKVFANATYQFVRKGDPLFTIYSPELVATQKEYLVASRSENRLASSRVEGVAEGAAALTASAEARLRQWNFSEAEIAQVEERGSPLSELTVYSSASGYITERNVLPNLYVDLATRLYTIADLSRVWVYAQVFQDDVGKLKPNDAAEITVDAYPGRLIRGRIESILPQVDMASRTVRVRLQIPNPNLQLKPGMFVNVNLRFALGKQLVVPASAVLQSGTRQLVFLDNGQGQLEPKDVLTGPRVGEELIILKGLTAHERVVTSANFLIDSESQLQAAANSFAAPSAAMSNKPEQSDSPPQMQLAFATEPNPPQKGNNTFRVMLTNADKTPETGAEVSVAFYMPAMPAMSMAAMTTKTVLKMTHPGVYEGPGVLGSGGSWHVTITAQKNGQAPVTKQLGLNATGGM